MKKWLSDLLKSYFFIFFPVVVVFTASLYVPSDSDLGWHLKYGEYFFQHGSVLRENIFSTMMAGFKWINSSWATDLLTYVTFKNSGFLGLSVLGALVISATFYFFAKAVKLSFFEKSILYPMLIYIERPFFNVSFRGQLLSLLGIGILFYLLTQFEDGKKSRLYLSIPLFFLWSNFHGQFLMGFGLFFLWGVIYIFTRWLRALSHLEKQSVLSDGKQLSLIFLLSIIAITINPFGVAVLYESLRHFGNPLQRYIVEWIPFERYSYLWWNLVAWDIIILLNLAILAIKKSFSKNLHYILPTIILLVLSFYVRRYSWSMVFISLPVIRTGVTTLEHHMRKFANTIGSLIFILAYLFIIFIKAPSENVIFMNWDRYCYQYVGCSPASAQFLVQKKYQEKMMTFYNWGGYLIWNYPDIKLSIDGRMHLWRDEKGYSAFMDYYPYEQNWKDIDASDYDVVYMTPKKPLYAPLAELVKMGKWKQVYQDSYASVFVRSQKKN